MRECTPAREGEFDQLLGLREVAPTEICGGIHWSISSHVIVFVDIFLVKTEAWLNNYLC